MNNLTVRMVVSLGALLACAGAALGRPDLIGNGSFESGLTGWSRADQLGSDGTFFDQTGASSPINGLSVASPPAGLHAAMSDAAGPGTHVLYQDFLVPTSVPGATLQFSLFINNTAGAFSTPASLDFSTPTLNQQARVDIMSASADAFSTNAADIFQNLFQTAVGSPPVTGYNVMTFDVTAVLTAHAGQTLRLRFAEVDNVNIFNLGVDAVSLNVVPAPSVALLALPVAFLRGRRSRR